MGSARRNRSNQIPRRDGAGRTRAGLVGRLAGAVAAVPAVFRSGSRRARALASAGAAGVVALVVVLAWLLWPAGNGPAKVFPASRERTYGSFAACLLTGPSGLQEPGAAAVWTGMQQASSAEAIQVRYQPVIGADTEANAVTYINTLASAGCDVVLVQGAAEAEALEARAAAYPVVHFVVVGGQRHAAANVMSITQASATATASAAGSATQSAESSQVATVIEEAEAGRFPGGTTS